MEYLVTVVDAEHAEQFRQALIGEYLGENQIRHPGERAIMQDAASAIAGFSPLYEIVSTRVEPKPDGQVNVFAEYQRRV